MEEYYFDRIRNGSTLSGEISLLLQYDGVAQADEGISYADCISFLVDSQDWGMFGQAGFSGASIDNLGRGCLLETSLYTYIFSDGEHVIAAALSSGEIIVERQVVFQNIIRTVRYDPIFDLTPGAEDIENKAHITAVLSPPQHWKVKITNPSDEVVKVFSGSGAMIDTFWDGTDANGEVVEDEAYLLTITATESNVSISPGFINKNSL